MSDKECRWHAQWHDMVISWWRSNIRGKENEWQPYPDPPWSLMIPVLVTIAILSTIVVVGARVSRGVRSGVSVLTGLPMTVVCICIAPDSSAPLSSLWVSNPLNHRIFTPFSLFLCFSGFYFPLSPLSFSFLPLLSFIFLPCPLPCPLLRLPPSSLILIWCRGFSVAIPVFVVVVCMAIAGVLAQRTMRVVTGGAAIFTCVCSIIVTISSLVIC